MKKQKSLKLNFMMNSLLSISSFIFPLITFPYVSRILLPEGTGKVQFATSLISYFTLFSQLGVPTYGIRICAKFRDDREKLSKTVHELFLLRLVTTLISYVALAIVLITVPRLYVDRNLYIIVSLNIFFTFIGMEWLYRALEKYTYITIRSVIFKLIAMIFMFLLVHQKGDYVIYGGITIFAGTASNILNFANIHKYIDMKPMHNYEIRKHIKPILVFFAMSCATTIYTHLDTVMLGFMATDIDVGYYGSAVKIKTILVSIITSLGAVLLPRSSYYIQQGKIKEFRRITAKGIQFVIFFSLPMTIYFMLFAKNGIYFLAGSKYNGSIMPMIVIMPTLFLIGLTNILGMQILVPTGRERFVLYSEIAGAIADVVINIILIPVLAATGAAIGTVVAEAIVFVVQYIFIRDEINYVFKQIKMKRYVIAILLSTLASIWIKKFIFLNDFIVLVISGLCFFGVYVLVLYLLKEEIVFDFLNSLIGVIKKRRRN